MSYQKTFHLGHGAVSGAILWATTCTLCGGTPPGEAIAATPLISLQDTVWPSAIVDLASSAAVLIKGRSQAAEIQRVWLRVTSSDGQSNVLTTSVTDGAFAATYPADFAGAAILSPGVLYIDASVTPDFRPYGPAIRNQAEGALILYDSRQGLLPDLPSAFTNDLLDARGRTDMESQEWPAIRSLVNLYMHSRGAALARVAQPEFDLARAGDMEFFRNTLTLYDFAHRDRDWSTPLKRRPHRHFWQAVWDHWFNASNNHPLDGNPANNDHGNFTPYTFTNDCADILLCYLARRSVSRPLDDNLATICTEALATLSAMQIRPGDPCKPDEGPGTFYYGMFETGEPMVEGTGWFANPDHHDHVQGGVFLGRAIWALGTGLRDHDDNQQVVDLARAVREATRWAFGASAVHGYCPRARDLVPARRALYPDFTTTARIWRDPGEHGYLLLGLLAAQQVRPDMVIFSAGEYDYAAEQNLTDICVAGLDALVATIHGERLWMRYSDKDATALAALAMGVRCLPRHPHAEQWRQAAIAVADAWITALPDPSTPPRPLVHIGFRPAPGKMTYAWPPNRDGAVRITFFKTGLWIMALAEMLDATGEARYRDRIERLIAYLCGANPFNARMLSELGGIYNWVDDNDGDGLEDNVRYNMYPESTAFCHYGIFRYMQACRRLQAPEGPDAEAQ